MSGYFGLAGGYGSAPYGSPAAYSHSEPAGGVGGSVHPGHGVLSSPATGVASSPLELGGNGMQASPGGLGGAGRSGRWDAWPYSEAGSRSGGDAASPISLNIVVRETEAVATGESVKWREEEAGTGGQSDFVLQGVMSGGGDGSVGSDHWTAGEQLHASRQAQDGFAMGFVPMTLQQLPPAGSAVMARSPSVPQQAKGSRTRPALARGRPAPSQAELMAEIRARLQRE
jgi:hypothetical protein